MTTHSQIRPSRLNAAPPINHPSGDAQGAQGAAEAPHTGDRVLVAIGREVNKMTNGYAVLQDRNRRHRRTIILLVIALCLAVIGAATSTILLLNQIGVVAVPTFSPSASYSPAYQGESAIVTQP